MVLQEHQYIPMYVAQEPPLPPVKGAGGEKMGKGLMPHRAPGDILN